MTVKQSAGAPDAARDLVTLLNNPLTRRALGARTMATAVALGLAGAMPRFAAAQSTDSTPAAAPDRPRGGSITIAVAGDADSLDPHHTTGPSWHIINSVNDQLVCINNNLEYEGIIAESWDISEDGLEYIFHLRSGVKFHDGSDVDAAAFKFTFDRMMDPVTNAPAAGWIKPLQASEVIDPLTLKLTLSEPFSPLLGQFCLNYFCPLPPAAVQEMGEDFGRNPIGAGPWKFKEWISGESITLARFEDYRNFHTYLENTGAPYLDEIVFQVIPEAETQMAALETGEVHRIALPPREVSRYQEDDQYEVIIDPASVGISMIDFNMFPPDGEFGASWKAPFDDIKVRQAVLYALDADAVIENVMYGLATRNYGLMPTGLFAYNPDIEQYGYYYDAAKAGSLLDEAGWVDSNGDGVREKDGADLEIIFWTYNDGGTTEKVLQIFQNQLSQVGIKANLVVLDSATFIATAPDGEWHMALNGWGWPEPTLLKMIAEATYGFSLYHDEEYITLLDKATQTPVQEERSAFYFQAQQKMLAGAALEHPRRRRRSQ